MFWHKVKYPLSLIERNNYCMIFNLDKIINKNTRAFLHLTKEKTIEIAGIKTYLHANENSFGSPLTKWYHRTPDTEEKKLKQSISVVKNLTTDTITLSNGLTEIIDTLYQSFCNSETDNVIVFPPTDSAPEMRAILHGLTVKKAPLLEDYQLNISHLETLVDDHTKIIWLCSPNNPTGNSIKRADIETILNNFNGLVVVNEMYINFSKQKSFLQELEDYPNLIVLQSLDIAWGLAGLQVAMAFASDEISAILNIVKPAVINTVTAELSCKALEEIGMVNDIILELTNMRIALKNVFEKMPFVQKVYPSDANFLFIKMKNAKEIYEYLIQKGILVSDFSNEPFCENCLRITVGTEQENTLLVDALLNYNNENYRTTM